MANRRSRWGAGFLASGLVVTLALTILVIAPGLQVHSRTAFGNTLTADLDPGEYAIYYTPGPSWAAVDCIVDPEGEAWSPRVDMTQHDIYVPQRWHSRGVLDTDPSGAVTVVCTSGGERGEFALGPVVDIANSAAGLALGLLAFLLLALGAVLLLRSRRAGSAAG